MTMGFFSRAARATGSSALSHEPREAVKLAQAYRWIFFGMDRKSVEREATKDLGMRPIRFGGDICGYDLTFVGKPFSLGMMYHQDRLYAIDFDYYGPDPYEVRDTLKTMADSMYGHVYAVSGDVMAWKTEDRLVRVLLNRGKKSATSVKLYMEYTPMTELMEKDRADRAGEAVEREMANFC